MKRFALGTAILLTAFATPALAFQCPKLVAELNTAAGNRFACLRWRASMALERIASTPVSGSTARISTAPASPSSPVTTLRQW